MAIYLVTDIKVALTRDDFEKLTEVPQDFTVTAVSMRMAALQIADTLTAWARPIAEMDEELLVEVVATVSYGDHTALQSARFVVDVFAYGDVDDKVRTYTGTL